MSKSMESPDIMKRKANITCLYETKWKGDKVKEVTDGYKLYYIGKNNARNGVGAVVEKNLKEKNFGV